MLTKIKTFVVSLPWWAWVIGILAVFFLWQSLSGWAMSRKVYNMTLDNIRVDQSNVVRVLEENMKDYEQEIKNLQRQLEMNRQQQASVRAENELLKGKVRDLQKQRENIVVPTDPGTLVNDFHSMGFRSARRIRNR